MSDRIRYVAAAQIAIDDAAAAQSAFDVDQQLARAQAYATLAAVEQSRAANLIAWKQFHITRAAGGIDSMLEGSDEISAEIERILGITA